MSTVQPRKPAGTPAGGEYAPKAGSAPGNALAGGHIPDEWACIECGDQYTEGGRDGLCADCATVEAFTASVMVDGEPANVDIRTLDQEQLNALRVEAAAHGDMDLVATISRVLDGRADQAWGHMDADLRRQWETLGDVSPGEACQWTDHGFYPAEAARMRTQGVYPHSAGRYAAGGIRNVDAILAWNRAGWSATDAVQMAADGFPGPYGCPPGTPFPPRRYRCDSLRSMAFGSLSETEKQAGVRPPSISGSHGQVTVDGRSWDGSPVVVSAVYQPAALPGFDIVGMSGDDVRTIRDRVRAGILNSGLQWPGGRVTVTVDGTRDSRSDAAVAAAVLAATGQIAPPPGEVWGEVGLGGHVYDVEG